MPRLLLAFLSLPYRIEAEVGMGNASAGRFLHAEHLGHQRTNHRVQQAGQRHVHGTLTHEIERQGRWKQGGGMLGRYTRGETAGSALRYL